MLSSKSKSKSRKQRLIEQKNESLSGENLTLKIQYNAVQEENQKLKDRLDEKDKQIEQTTGNLKDLATKYGGTGKRNKQVHSQSNGFKDQKTVLRQKNTLIDSLQKQLKRMLFDIIF